MYDRYAEVYMIVNLRFMLGRDFEIQFSNKSSRVITLDMCSV